MIEVAPEHLTILRDILVRHVPGLTIWAYGSRTTGKSKPYSDLDLVVMAETPLPMRKLAELAEDLADSDLPFRVDVSDWASLPDSWHQRIERQHVVIR